ncbi:MAG: hypothetical protein ABIO70_05895 [Pseudomonadota bacterium]
MRRRPLARYVPPTLLVATCLAGGPSVTSCAEDGGMPFPTEPGPGDLEGPDIVVEPEAVGFGAVAIGSVATEEVQICNAGDEGLLVLGIEADEGEAFSASAPLTESLAPGACTTFEVIFTPVAVGQAEDTLWVESDDPDHAYVSVALSGEGHSGD